MRNWIVIPFICILFTAYNARCESDDLDTQLMLNTFKIFNPKSSATVFVMARSTPESKDLIVTADHVFSKMEGDEATLYMRKKDDKDPDLWIKVPVKINVRKDGKPLWTKHPDADVAVMPFKAPIGMSVQGISMELLATDELLKRYEIHPGDTIKCAGYPHPNQFNSGPAWFPVIRQGCIAGFPLMPMTKFKTFLTDLHIFEGNSGGPIYLTDNNRFYNGKTQCGRVQLIVGLLSEQHFINDKFETVYESGQFKHQLGLGVIANAQMIRETIDLASKVPVVVIQPSEKKAAQ